MSKISVDLSKGAAKIEGDAAAVLKFLTHEEVTITSDAPKALAGLGVLVSATDKALSDAAADAANPTQLILNLPSNVADFKGVWSAVKALVKDIGVSI